MMKNFWSDTSEQTLSEILTAFITLVRLVPVKPAISLRETALMAHLLHRLGAAALRIRKTVEGKVIPPLISREEAMTLREQFYRDRQWVKYTE